MSDNPTCDRCGASYQDVAPAKDCDWCTVLFDQEGVECPTCGATVSLANVSDAETALEKIVAHHTECT
jgi:uncharacterized Zn finger protein (UPF0148 family)